MQSHKLLLLLLSNICALVSLQRVCHLSDCNLNSPLNCSLASDIAFLPSFPVTPRTKLLPSGRTFPHLFDFFYDPNGTNCVYISLYIKKQHISDGFLLVMSISHTAVIYHFEVLTVNFESLPGSGCFRRVDQSSSCAMTERLRLTLLDRENFLLEDVALQDTQMYFRSRSAMSLAISDACVRDRGDSYDGHYWKMLARAMNCSARKVEHGNNKRIPHKMGVVSNLNSYKIVLAVLLVLQLILILCDYLFHKSINLHEPCVARKLEIVRNDTLTGPKIRLT